MPDKPCQQGHLSPRYVRSGRKCVECVRAARKANYRKNKDAYKRRAKEWVEKNHERSEEWRKAYAKRNRVAITARATAWAKANKQRRAAIAQAWVERNPEKRKEAANSWSRRNPDSHRVSASKRRALKYGSASRDPKALMAYSKMVRNAERLRCYWCRKNTPKGQRHIDHIIPLARGGADVIGNLCVSCPRCNISKNAKLPHEFSGQAELHLA
jgi:5-methylcytosine-specific restriction endonuclease McrA